MARRQGAEGFQSNKKARKLAKQNRTQDTRNERKAVILACEDSISAPLYFRSIFNDLKINHAIAASSLVIAEHRNHTDPCSVLQNLLDFPDNTSFDHRWIVIDRDIQRTNGGGHTLADFNTAFTDARRNGVEVAYANPCFEIWYLLHYEFRNTAIDRDELKRKLENEIHYQKNQLPVLTSEQQCIAIRNAEKLISSWRESQGRLRPETDNPSTTVHKLVTLLNGFKKTRAQ